MANHYRPRFQIFFEQHLSLMKSTKVVDLVLILAAHFKILLADGSLVFSRELQYDQDFMINERTGQRTYHATLHHECCRNRVLGQEEGMTIGLVRMRSVGSLFQRLLLACRFLASAQSEPDRSGWRRYVTGRIFHISSYVLYPGPASLPMH